MKTRSIDNDVLAVLSAALTVGRELRITAQLERKLYARTNQVLEALGGKWNRKARAHVFDADAGELLEAVLLTGEIALPADFGFFPTPEPVIDALLAHANVRPGMRVLEPSAGDGAIAQALWPIGVELVCVELLERNLEQLRACGFAAIAGDFLDVPPRPEFDRVVMNPPFAKRADVHHVLHAHRFLKPSGRLVSVMSAGVEFRDDRLATDFRAFVEAHGGIIEPLPPGSFEESGTGVNTVLVVIDGSEGVRADVVLPAPIARRARAPSAAAVADLFEGA